MTDSVSRLKELLFDRETATLGEISRRIEELATAEEKARLELIAAGRQLETATSVRFEELARLEAANRTLQDDLARRIAHLDQRTGTPEALRTSVAAVFDDVIVEARQNKQEDVSRALAPMLVKTIKAELKNNQAEMVEALYPITGQLVKAYVASAMKDLTNRMNRRLQSNAFMLRVRSLFSGYSIAELALAETQQLEVEELYLVRRGSGELLQRWPGNPIRSNSDIHMSSVMAAINDFATQAFQTDGGQLRSFHLDDFTVYLRASPVYLLAAKCRGVAVPGVDSLIDNEFLAAVTRHHEMERAPGSTGTPPLHSALLTELRSRLETKIAGRHEELSRAGLPFSPTRALVALAMLALIGGAGWYGWNMWEQEATRSKARTTIAETSAMNGYPVLLDVEGGGRAISIAGVAPSQAAKTLLLRRLTENLPGVAIEDRGFAAMPPAAIDVTPQIEAVKRDVTTLENQTARTAILSTTLRSLERAERRLGDTLPELAMLTSRTPDPRRKSIASIEEDTRRALIEIRGEQEKIRNALPDGTERSAIIAAMLATAQQLRTAANTVTGTTPSQTAAQTANRSRAPASLTESAQEISLAAERLATAATATLQAASLSIPAHPSARDRLRAYVGSHAIFFANSDDFRDVPAANAVIDEVARLARETTGLIRVVGYTDERGAQTRNAPLAQSRADKVLEALVAKSFPRARLVAIGRSTGPDLSPSTGPDSANRRVEFEIGYDQEPVSATR
jgi:outer membrane protein OmpA-like peptidoglycan-associated protein